jgi:glycosyltransferase involved in cell wall biosynthesis
MDLFVGMTTWNDEQVLSASLAALKQTLEGVTHEIQVFDNSSIDSTAEIVKQFGCKIKTGMCLQPEALNYLLDISRARYTLLIHSDVIMLASNWFSILSGLLNEECVLASPEDIGLGNYLRDYGRGMPESSFLFFDTNWAQRTRSWNFINGLRRLKNRRGGFWQFDFYGPHVTHHIPQVIRRSRKRWAILGVLPSQRQDDQVYSYKNNDSQWNEDAAHRIYGYGNFYYWGETITHYHNWFSRWKTRWSHKELNPYGTPVKFLSDYSERFIQDFRTQKIRLPPIPHSHEKYGF